MIRLSTRRPIAISMVYLAAALLGVAAWQNLPIELLPDTALPRLYIDASWPGASSEATEARLTSLLESAVQQVRGVEKVTSESYHQDGTGYARLEVYFARDTDMDFARLELSERLAALAKELPEGVRPPAISPYVPPEFEEQSRPFLSYTVSGPYTLEALRAYIEDEVVPELLQVEGVGHIDVQGGRQRILEIELDPTKIQALGLTLGAVQARLGDLEYVRQAGAVQDGGTRRTLAIRHRAGSLEEVARLPLLTDRGRVVRVADVARLHDTYEDAWSYYRIDGEPAVSFTVHKAPRTNAVRVADRVKARLAALEDTRPPGVRFFLDNDESREIRAQLSDLRYRALLSAGVVFVVLLLFLGSFRSAAIVFATIGFSILITLNFIYFGGLTLNLLTLMGLAMGFGLLVDNAIVVLENVYRLRRSGLPAEEAAVTGVREVVLAVLAATLTTLVVLIPFVYFQGELRIYYVPLAIVVGLSLLASLFVAFTFIPALAARLLRGPGEGARPEGDGPARPPFYVRLYSRLIGLTLRHPWPTVALALLALGGSYLLFDKYVTRGVNWNALRGGDTYISITIRLPRGEELERTDELARYFEQRLRAIPEVERFVTRVYPQSVSIRVTFPDSLELTWVPLAVKEQLISFGLQFGGAQISVYGYGPGFSTGGYSSSLNYYIKVLGYNYETVREIAEDLAARLRRFSRVRDVNTNATGRWAPFADEATELVLELDRRRLAVHGLSARDVVQYVATAVRGEAAVRQNFHLGGDAVRLTVKLAGNRNLDVLGLQDLLIPSSSGTSVRLGDVGRLVERQVMSRIYREDQQYQRFVSYEFRGPAKLGDRVQKAVVDATHLPPGYKLETRSEWRWSDEERVQIYTVLAIAILLVFMVTAALFESIRQPLCVLLTVPMALIGVFLIFFYTGASFTREAYVGVIMMSGIVVNNAILLVDHINQLRRNHGLALEAVILQGTLDRVRPILMTSATTVFGLLPLVISGESADANIWNALGYALMGGLTSSTILVLTVTPALYLLFERRRARRGVGAQV